MAAPVSRPQPDITRWKRRDMEISVANLEFDLRSWIKEVTDYIGQNANMEGVSPPSYLVATADGVDRLRYAPTAMATRNGNKTQSLHTVFANYVWGQRQSGYWFIRHVAFTLTKNEDAAAQKAQYQQYLKDKAQDEYDKSFHAREAVFKAEEHVQTWQKDYHTGETRLNALMEQVAEWGRKEASMPENPYTWSDIALSFAGAGVSKVASRAEKVEALAKMYKGAGVATKEAKETIELAEELKRSKKLAEFYEKIDKAKTWGERAELLKKIAEGQEGDLKNPKYDISRTDQLIDFGVDAAAEVLDAFIPGAGGLLKMFAGMMWEMAHASQTKIVTTIRARVYTAFVGGFIEGLTLVGSSELKNPKDKEYYDKGYRMASHMTPQVSFEYQIALLHYATEYYTSGFWQGSSFEVHGLKNQDWSFPDDYKAQWSPELLGRAFLTKFWRAKYLWQGQPDED